MLADHREYQYTKLALAGATAKKKPPKDFSRSGFFFDNPSQRRNVNVTGPSFVSDTCI